MSLVKVAKFAGVSKATVSRVINQQGTVHPDTVRLVRQAIDKLGYQPSYPRQGRHLKQNGDTAAALSAFALVIPEASGGLYLSLQSGFAAAAREEYQQIIVCNTDNDIYRQADQILQLMNKKVGGVAMVTATSSPTPPHHIEMLQKSGIPVVLLHRPVAGVTVPLIHLPLEQVGYMAGQTIAARGHRRIAIFPNVDTPSSQLHRLGFGRALQEVGLAPSTALGVRSGNLIPITPDTGQAIRESLERMWKLPANERPTAIFVTFDSIAELVYLSLMQMGVRVPEDISLVSFGGAYRHGVLAKLLCAITVDETRAGALAVKLFNEIRSGERAIDVDERVELALALSEGETLGPPAGSEFSRLSPKEEIDRMV